VSPRVIQTKKGGVGVSLQTSLKVKEGISSAPASGKKRGLNHLSPQAKGKRDSHASRKYKKEKNMKKEKAEETRRTGDQNKNGGLDHEGSPTTLLKKTAQVFILS